MTGHEDMDSQEQEGLDINCRRDPDMSGPGTGQPAAAGADRAAAAAVTPPAVTRAAEGVYGTLAAAAAAPAPAADSARSQEPPDASAAAATAGSSPDERGPPRRRLPRLPLRPVREWDSSESDQEQDVPQPAPPRHGRLRRTLRALRMTRSLMSRCRSGRGAPVSPPPPVTAPAAVASGAAAAGDAPTAESRLLVSHFTELGRDGSLVQRTVHTTVDFVHRLVPDLLHIVNSPFYWGEMDRFEAERLLENKPEGTFLLRDSAQEEYLFSVSFRRYGRSLHARVEQWERRFSFDAHDPAVFAAATVTALIEHYKDAGRCMFFEPLLTRPLPRSFVFPLSHLCRAAIVDRVGYDEVAQLKLPRVLRMFLKEYHYKQPVRVRRFELPEDGGEPVERTRRHQCDHHWMVTRQ
ncbi:uncharacterized protein LOC122391255 [Amphibalanus amphitrite]|uniref:uncharacterized protein LOC122391255 n=1 Tax=Amphibalanus amphitrite TaxID=1232801 RepID=UPI001C9262FF|nr:uncharacterized protein LOC122391255 [Amphibalanus amphitrite]XP_043240939.1 uncharacterized protein LOC122391255 [Amphibalanus amphitrite]XP_043240940.1 uncharacterized protein LOC122391255 [Amphibalanus amphitrite]XP_043240941.1 uncharacterized protein LOC122391255 [Amphibalanus amphitrite]XP_043240943.1 uncharacterized protein LOC122391255 [Amphibalanus amphitrite]